MKRSFIDGRRFVPIFPLLSLLLLSACASTGKQAPVPDWVSGEAKRYPAQGYLLGRGEAGTLEDAGNRARADLARVFEVEVRAESHDVQRFERHSGGPDRPKAEESGSLELSRSVSTNTQKVLRGASIAETWQDPLTGIYHALAVLGRPAAAQGLRDEIGGLDRATEREIERARAAGDPFASIASAQAAVDDQAERAALQRMLQVVDITGQGVTPRWALAGLRADRDALLARITVRTEAAGEDGDTLARALAGAASEAGFTVAGDGQYRLAAVLGLDDLGPREGWYWVNGTLELAMHDARGNERGVRRWEIKTAARDAQTTRRRAVEEAVATLQRDLRATLLGFAAGARD
jgi:hypothetical protein